MSFKAKLAMWRERKAERTGVEVDAHKSVEEVEKAVVEAAPETSPVVEEPVVPEPVVEPVAEEPAPEVVEEDEEELDEMTKDELYDLATELDIDGRSTMTKAELLEAVEAASK